MIIEIKRASVAELSPDDVRIRARMSEAARGLYGWVDALDASDMLMRVDATEDTKWLWFSGYPIR